MYTYNVHSNLIFIFIFYIVLTIHSNTNRSFEYLNKVIRIQEVTYQ